MHNFSKSFDLINVRTSLELVVFKQLCQIYPFFTLIFTGAVEHVFFILVDKILCIFAVKTMLASMQSRLSGIFCPFAFDLACNFMILLV